MGLFLLPTFVPTGLSVQLLFFPDSVTDDDEEEEDPAAKGPQLPKVGCGC